MFDTRDLEPSLPPLRPAVARLSEAVQHLAASAGDELPAASAEEFVASLRELEVVRRRLDAATAALVGRLDRSGAHGVDGHRTARSCLQHLGRLSGAEAGHRVGVARALRVVPVLADAFASGRVPTGHVQAVARVAANPRVQGHLADADPLFAEHAQTMAYAPFRCWLAHWESMADADGAFAAAARAHERRSVTLDETLDGSWMLRGTESPLRGAAMREILDAFTDAETRADWAEARARLGGTACRNDLARTPTQRRADAVFAIFRRAASAPAEGETAKPLVNVIVDEQAFLAELRHRARLPHRPPTRADRSWCQSLDGTPLTPSDAVDAALVGLVRRVVIDSHGTVINVGRKRRLFTGSSRNAVVLTQALASRDGPRCRWPGCDAGRTHCQVDHLTPWRAGGGTDVANGVLLCGVHNRLKEHGFRPVRAPDGSWEFLRPDRSPITSAA